MGEPARKNACKILRIDKRTLRCWKRQSRIGNGLKDRRKEAADGRIPPNRLTEKKKTRIVDVCNQAEYHNSAPSQIVPRASRRKGYIPPRNRVFIGCCMKRTNSIAEVGQNPPKAVIKPKGHKGTNVPNEVWSWDITYLPVCYPRSVT